MGKVSKTGLIRATKRMDTGDRRKNCLRRFARPQPAELRVKCTIELYRKEIKHCMADASIRNAAKKHNRDECIKYCSQW